VVCAGNAGNRPPSGGTPAEPVLLAEGAAGGPGRTGRGSAGTFLAGALQRLEHEPHRGLQLRVMPRGPVVGREQYLHVRVDAVVLHAPAVFVERERGTAATVMWVPVD